MTYITTLTSVAAASLCFVAQLSATLIISDDFERFDDEDVIRNSEPLIGPDWEGSQGYTAFEGSLRSATTGSGHFIGMNMGAENYFTDNAGIYTLSADVLLTADSSDSFQIGFNPGVNESTGANRTMYSTDDRFSGTPVIGLNGQGQLLVYSGSNSIVYDVTNAAYAGGTEYNLKLVLNTSGSTWTLAAFIDDTQLDLDSGSEEMSVVYSTNPTGIDYVTIASNIDSSQSATSYIDNFQLDFVSVPEPSVSGIALGVIVGISVWRRRR